MTIGEIKSKLRDLEDRRAIPNTSEQHRKEDTKEITPSLAEGVVPDQIIRDHIGIAVDLEANREIEAEAQETEQESERSRQRSQKASS